MVGEFLAKVAKVSLPMAGVVVPSAWAVTDALEICALVPGCGFNAALFSIGGFVFLVSLVWLGWKTEKCIDLVVAK